VTETMARITVGSTIERRSDRDNGCHRQPEALKGLTGSFATRKSASPVRSSTARACFDKAATETRGSPPRVMVERQSK